MNTRAINRLLFKQEKLRDKYAVGGNIKQFIDTYKEEIVNLNSQDLWNNKFQDQELISNQDLMTKEKISYIANFIKNRIKILDLGIGQGYLEQLLSKRNVKCKLSGIDISKIAIDRAKDNYKGHFYVDNILNADKYFDENYF